MLMDSGMVALGLVLLFLGGEFLVRGAVAIAERFGISKMVIGLTVVGFGTSMPELLVSVQAALRGAPEIALGNVVGSNIANVLLIIGVGALIMPISGWNRSAVRDALIATLAALVLFGLVRGEAIDRIEGIALLAVLFVYLGATFWLESRSPESTALAHGAEEFEDIPVRSPWLQMVLVVAGIALLMLGAGLLVDGATAIARTFGVSDAVIGLSLVAIGTSLPELATAIVAAIRKHSDVVLGNVIGSNIFNILAILGTTAVIVPIPVSQRFRDTDTLTMLLVSVGLIGLLLVMRKIGRLIGLAMLLGYVAYIYLLF